MTYTDIRTIHDLIEWIAHVPDDEWDKDPERLCEVVTVKMREIRMRGE